MQDVRVLIATGALVAHPALYVVLADDDAVEIIYIEIDDARQADPRPDPIEPTTRLTRTRRSGRRDACSGIGGARLATRR